MSTGAVVLVVAVVGALTLGLARAATDGRFRGTKSLPQAPDDQTLDAAAEAHQGVLDGTRWFDLLGSRATLLQFSSAFCAPCRATRRILGEVTGAEEGVAHVEVDAEQHLDLVRRVGVLRTPTTLVLDATGREIARAAGAPTKAQVLDALATVSA